MLFRPVQLVMAAPNQNNIWKFICSQKLIYLNLHALSIDAAIKQIPAGQHGTGGAVVVRYDFAISDFLHDFGKPTVFLCQPHAHKYTQVGTDIKSSSDAVTDRGDGES